MTQQNQPELIVVAGPNGAGKTTTAFKIFPKALSLVEFLNADEIARGISPLNPSAMRISAGKLLIKFANQLIGQRTSFGFETTLAPKNIYKLMVQAQEAGYSVSLLYFWLSSPELALSRVAARVRAGGHNIDNEEVIRRYHRSVSNLIKIYLPLVDDWMIFDNSSNVLKLIAGGSKSVDTNAIMDIEVWENLLEGSTDE